jgi:hypothetical protein
VKAGVSIGLTSHQNNLSAVPSAVKKNFSSFYFVKMDDLIFPYELSAE